MGSQHTPQPELFDFSLDAADFRASLLRRLTEDSRRIPLEAMELVSAAGENFDLPRDKKPEDL